MSVDRDDEIDTMIARQLATLRDRPPERDLWPTIAPRLQPRYPRGTFVMRWPVALAAGILVAFVSATGTVVALRRSDRGPAADAAASSLVAREPGAAPSPDQSLAAAIRDLESEFDGNRLQLDPKARQSVKKSLVALDLAIADIESMRKANPDNVALSNYLIATMRKKLDVLRTVVMRGGVQS